MQSTGHMQPLGACADVLIPFSLDGKKKGYFRSNKMTSYVLSAFRAMLTLFAVRFNTKCIVNILFTIDAQGTDSMHPLGIHPRSPPCLPCSPVVFQ